MTTIGAEALKLRTLLMPGAVLAAGAVLSGVIGHAAVDIAADSSETPTLAELAVAPGQVLWFGAVIVAVLATAGEYHHRTIVGTLIQAPRRGRLLTAKAVVLAAYGSLLAAGRPRRRAGVRAG